MKTIFIVFSLFVTSSLFAAVHCDKTKGTRMHSSRELNVGTKAFSTAIDCEFSSFVANKAGNGIACAPYSDRNTSGFSVFRLDDGKDLGPTVFSSLTECNLSVSFSDDFSFCIEYKGKFYFWDIDDDVPYNDGPYPSLLKCIVQLNN